MASTSQAILYLYRKALVLASELIRLICSIWGIGRGGTGSAPAASRSRDAPAGARGQPKSPGSCPIKFVCSSNPLRTFLVHNSQKARTTNHVLVYSSCLTAKHTAISRPITQRHSLPAVALQLRTKVPRYCVSSTPHTNFLFSPLQSSRALALSIQNGLRSRRLEGPVSSSHPACTHNRFPNPALPHPRWLGQHIRAFPFKKMKITYPGSIFSVVNLNAPGG